MVKGQAKMVLRRAIGRFFFLAFIVLQQGADQVKSQNVGGFVQTNGTRFIVNGDIVYFSGFNAYWMMLESSVPSERWKVSTALEQASSYGLNLARTWAFSDGGQSPLQSSPGFYNETMFTGLDFVISEAKRNKIYLILSLVNNFEGFGGKKQYVQWARERGQINLSSDDAFYTNDVIKGYYKNHVKTVLTRINTLTGLAYKDDPTIFAWELINEPRCDSDLSGGTVQAWVEEMAAFVKSIDNKHLLEVGMEGFYTDSMQGRRQFNPGGYLFGTDFISQNQVQGIDFATIHAYPEWYAKWSSGDKLRFLQNWTQIHVSDSSAILKKPLLNTEFGWSWKPQGSTVNQRDAFYGQVYESAFASARDEGPLGGVLFWQLLVQGMDSLNDGYEIVPTEQRSTMSIVSQISRRISVLNDSRRRG